MNKNLLLAAIAGKDAAAIDEVADAEGVEPGFVRGQIASGRIAVMQRDGAPALGIGEGLRTKINANIGTSAEVFNPDDEVEKARVAEKYGADTISDLSMGGDIDAIRLMILEQTRVPLTTVPIYQTVVEMGAFGEIKEQDFVRMIKRHTGMGVSSIVVHAGFTLEMLEKLRSSKRIMGMVSKGGSITSAWMLQNQKENPFLSHFDEICGLLTRKNIVLSLGNTMRSGCVHDRTDSVQEMEMEMNASLARRANEHGVQVIIEGMGGHVSPEKIPALVARYKRMTNYRPLFVAGPLPLEIGVGYDHISGCVGGSIAAGAGADYLCYITPSEHLGLPNAAQVREGVVAFKIAAHIGDTLKYGPRIEDKILAGYRRARDWEGQFAAAIDGDRAREIHQQDKAESCSMCGKYCAILLMEEYLK